MRYRWWRYARCRVKHGRACPHLENHSGRPRVPRPRIEFPVITPARSTITPAKPAITPAMPSPRPQEEPQR